MTKTKTVLIPTILCGGAGTRLWPLSRDEYPKQLLPLVGPETMLQATVRRMSGFAHEKAGLAAAPMVVCNEDHRFLVAQQIKGMGYNENQSVFIPAGGKHRVENPGQVALEIIEVQSGSYLGEDDIVRLEDQYGRA